MTTVDISTFSNNIVAQTKTLFKSFVVVIDRTAPDKFDVTLFTKPGEAQAPSNLLSITKTQFEEYLDQLGGAASLSDAQLNHIKGRFMVDVTRALPGTREVTEYGTLLAMMGDAVDAFLFIASYDQRIDSTVEDITILSIKADGDDVTIQDYECAVSIDQADDTLKAPLIDISNVKDKLIARGVTSLTHVSIPGKGSVILGIADKDIPALVENSKKFQEEVNTKGSTAAFTVLRQTLINHASDLLDQQPKVDIENPLYVFNGPIGGLANYIQGKEGYDPAPNVTVVTETGLAFTRVILTEEVV